MVKKEPKEHEGI